MTKQEFISLYGKSVYQVRLEAALHALGRYSPVDALELASQFLELLLAEDSPE
jgi:hypothetical protein